MRPVALGETPIQRFGPLYIVVGETLLLAGALRHCGGAAILGALTAVCGVLAINRIDFPKPARMWSPKTQAIEAISILISLAAMAIGWTYFGAEGFKESGFFPLLFGGVAASVKNIEHDNRMSEYKKIIKDRVSGLINIERQNTALYTDAIYRELAIDAVNNELSSIEDEFRISHKLGLIGLELILVTIGLILDFFGKHIYHYASCECWIPR